jgi:hypothetical protein
MHNEGSFGKNADARRRLSLTSLKVDISNRGHGHLVICSSAKSVEQGKLCDAIERQCVQASKCSRKINVSTSNAVFEFIDAKAAEAMLVQSLPNIFMQKALPYITALCSHWTHMPATARVQGVKWRTFHSETPLHLQHAVMKQ